MNQPSIYNKKLSLVFCSGVVVVTNKAQTFYRFLGALVILAVIWPLNSLAQVYNTSAKHALLMDADTGTVLFEKDASVPMPPASMAKLMTVEVVFNALRTGEVGLDDPFYISENAWRKGGANSGGSTMFAELNSEVPLRDILRGIIVQSGNDACIALAEGLAGNEETFAVLMNERAKELGLNGSNFRNSTGLPDPDQYVTAQDLAKLARHLIKTYPEFYAIYSEPEFTWNDITQRNRNPLLGAFTGADGLKTGYTNASGYGLVGSAVQNGQRLITVINGLSSSKARAAEARGLLNWGFRAFRALELFEVGGEVGRARVFGGETRDVGLTGEGPIRVYVPVGNRDRIRANIVYDRPIPAPVFSGDRIGEIEIFIGDKLAQRTPLYANADVPVGGLSRRAMDGLEELLLGWL